MSFNYKQNFYEVINEEKYVGGEAPFFRSGLEERMMYYLDHNKNVIKWCYERVIVPYISPIDNKAHRYFVDFFAKVKDMNGDIINFLMEVKPFEQTLPPRKPKTKRKKSQIRYQIELKTYMINQAKWKFASEYARKKGWEFVVVTEKDILN